MLVGVDKAPAGAAAATTSTPDNVTSSMALSGAVV
jgi:hypothetical protein